MQLSLSTTDADALLELFAEQRTMTTAARAVRIAGNGDERRRARQQLAALLEVVTGLAGAATGGQVERLEALTTIGAANGGVLDARLDWPNPGRLGYYRDSPDRALSDADREGLARKISPPAVSR